MPERERLKSFPFSPERFNWWHVYARCIDSIGMGSSSTHYKLLDVTRATMGRIFPNASVCSYVNSLQWCNSVLCVVNLTSQLHGSQYKVDACHVTITYKINVTNGFLDVLYIECRLKKWRFCEVDIFENEDMELCARNGADLCLYEGQKLSECRVGLAERKNNVDFWPCLVQYVDGCFGRCWKHLAYSVGTTLGQQMSTLEQ